MQPSQWEGGQTYSAPVAKQTCKPVPKRCEDAGGNSRTICQGELREQFLSSRCELSAARQALEAAQLAPGTLATLAALHQPRQKTFCTSRIFGKRDRGTRPLSNVSSWTRNFSSSTSGQRGGCSSWSVRHDVRPLFSAAAKVMFAEFAQSLAVADVPHQVLRTLGLGRLIALKKPDGGVRRRVKASGGKNNGHQRS